MRHCSSGHRDILGQGAPEGCLRRTDSSSRCKAHAQACSRQASPSTEFHCRTVLAITSFGKPRRCVASGADTFACQLVCALLRATGSCPTSWVCSALDHLTVESGGERQRNKTRGQWLCLVYTWMLRSPGSIRGLRNDNAVCFLYTTANCCSCEI